MAKAIHTMESREAAEAKALEVVLELGEGTQAEGSGRGHR